jgi:serine-protein kinase ATM
MDILLRLGIVSFPVVSEIVRSILLSIEIAGPALVTETSSSLMITLLHERTRENPTYFDQTADRILYWLLSKWTPSKTPLFPYYYSTHCVLGLFPDRAYASLNAHHCNARDVIRILYSCLDKPQRPFKASTFIVLGSVAQAREHTSQYRDLINYLLLLETPNPFKIEPDDAALISESPSGERPAQLEANILDFFIAETDKIRQRWKEWSREKERGITTDMMRILTNFIFVASAIASTAHSSTTRLSKFAPVLDSLSQSFSQFMARREVDQYKVDAVLEVLSQTLPDIHALLSLDGKAFSEIGAYPFAHHLSHALDKRRGAKESFYTEDDDFMDVDDTNNSQLVGGKPSPDNEVPRQDLLALTNSSSLRSSSSIYLHLISALAEIMSDNDIIPSGFMDYVVALPEPELLHSRQVIDALFMGRFTLSQTACQNLFQKISVQLIDPRAREYNTSELSHGMMVQILIGTTQIWCEPTDDQTQELHENAEDLYEYYVKSMEKGGVRRSPNLQKTLVDLLIRLFMILPHFGSTRKVPSVRTSLYELLDQGDIIAQYQISRKLPQIFETFVLAQHERVFEDIQSSLPHDPKWIEGIAIRVLVLCRLASRWYTLVRICIYGIFETAGLIDEAASYAKRCTLEVAKARQLQNPQHLFKLFAPQILFSWLSTGESEEKRHFADIPYSIFQYDSLANLLRDVEPEAMGQAIMFGNREEVEYVAQTLGTNATETLKNNFPRAAAYALAYDTCRGSQRNQAIASSMKLLSSIVGEEQFYPLMQQHFPRVLGIILQTTAYEDKFEKALSKRPAFGATAKALAEMTKIQHSEDGERYQVFQPCFTAAYLFDLLDRLCRRVGKDASNFWTASLFTYVMRMLLGRIHPAFGSLYARSVIRKIRILIALAGPVAHKDYPLQMTLQSLRPFLTDVHCAEDTLGIMQYLFAHGSLFLGNQLSFVTGISLSILISIRAFLGSAQDSTTQESQYTTTKNKTQSFHSWFTRYLENYADSLAATKQTDNSYIKAFRSITTAASRVRTEGNSLRGTEESKLLLEILDDIRTGRNLLTAQSREVALDLLCQNFQPAPSSREDVLGGDADVAQYASQVWQSCQRANVGDGYLLWAARVLGRTFSANGELNKIPSQLRSWSAHILNPNDPPARCSRIAIVQKLLDLRFSDNREEVGLAEDGLRLILRKLSDAEAADLEKIVPSYIADALDLTPLEEGSMDHASPNESLKRAVYTAEKKDVSLWVKNLATALCYVGCTDSILGSLARIIRGIDGMAEKMLPCILHLVLLQEVDTNGNVRKIMSDAYSAWFQDLDAQSKPYIKILIECILYLRTQKLPREVTRVERDKWLEVDYLMMAEAATACGMYKSALLFAETYGSQPTVISSTRRQSTLAPPPQIPTELQISIYKNLDEPDSYYGVEQESSLSSVLERLDYEGDGVKSLLFRGARMDSQMRRQNKIDTPDSRGTIKSLIMLNMNSVTQSLLSNDQFRNLGDETVESTLHTAKKLGQWDIRAPEGNHTESSTLFKAFQGIHYASDALTARKQLDRQFLATMRSLAQTDRFLDPVKVPLRTLAVLNEADEIISCTTPIQLLDCWDQMKAREKWMTAGQ